MDRQGAGFFVPFFYWKLAAELPFIPFHPLWAGLFYQSFTRLHPFCLFICLYNFSLLLLTLPLPPVLLPKLCSTPWMTLEKCSLVLEEREREIDAGVGICTKYQHLLCDRGGHSPPSSHYPSAGRVGREALPGSGNTERREGGGHSKK